MCSVVLCCTCDGILCCAIQVVLCYTVLCYTVLCYVKLCGIVLCSAYCVVLRFWGSSPYESMNISSVTELVTERFLITYFETS